MSDPRPVHVVVYDVTQRRFPWLTQWWKIGGTAARIARLADVVIGADSWMQALRGVSDAMRARSGEGSAARIGVLQFWGHGVDGAMLLGGERLDRHAFDVDSPIRRHLDDLRDAMDSAHGVVWFRGCHTFRGEAGQQFARAAAAFFNVPVVGQTYLIWALHSGTHVLAPRAQPGWPRDEGSPCGKWSIGSWSGPTCPNTVTALKFFPPRRDV